LAIVQEINSLEEGEITLEGCISRLKESNNIYIQIELVEHLTDLKGLDFVVEGLASLREVRVELLLTHVGQNA